jgi:tetratricopeptide (TPR) repeat protein
LLCLLGDIKREAKFYEQAWEESGHKCARAMRSLGRMRFYENKFEESIACFNRAFEINRLYPKEWFTCGCAHMRLEQFDKAIFCFGNVVSIDETQTDAWANIANCYAVQNKFAEALACTEQALREKRSDWRIWHNCIKFSIACG